MSPKTIEVDLSPIDDDKVRIRVKDLNSDQKYGYIINIPADYEDRADLFEKEWAIVGRSIYHIFFAKT